MLTIIFDSPFSPFPLKKSAPNRIFAPFAPPLPIYIPGHTYPYPTIVMDAFTTHFDPERTITPTLAVELDESGNPVIHTVSY